jgi:hypothetical protein
MKRQALNTANWPVIGASQSSSVANRMDQSL